VVTDAVLVVDKPSALTSFDVVRRIRRAAGLRRVGHGGTLDPLASGVLPVCLGEATKLARFLLDADKEYEVTFCLGVETDTLDADGTVTATRDASGVGEAAVQQALAALTGPILQVPPAYSAIKRAGKPLYEYARAGEAVVVPPRAVVVHALELVAWAGPGAVSLRVRCSKGTYVRSLVADLGRAVGVGAHVTVLRRTRSGPFAAASARPLAEVVAALAERRTADLGASLMTMDAALAHLPRCFADEGTALALTQGKRVPWHALGGDAAPGDTDDDGALYRVLRADGTLLAVVARRGDDSVASLRVFLPPRQPPEENGRQNNHHTR
jgi:tRNA pseudouridine55 synthase